MARHGDIDVFERVERAVMKVYFLSPNLRQFEALVSLRQNRLHHSRTVLEHC